MLCLTQEFLEVDGENDPLCPAFLHRINVNYGGNLARLSNQTIYGHVTVGDLFGVPTPSFVVREPAKQTQGFIFQQDLNDWQIIVEIVFLYPGVTIVTRRHLTFKHIDNQITHNNIYSILYYEYPLIFQVQLTERKQLQQRQFAWLSLDPSQLNSNDVIRSIKGIVRLHVTLSSVYTYRVQLI